MGSALGNVEAASLEIPGWVPRLVAVEAQILFHLEKPEHVAVLQRMISDIRMRKVWLTLLRRKRDGGYRSTEMFLYPTILSGENLISDFDVALSSHISDLELIHNIQPPPERQLIKGIRAQENVLSELAFRQELALSKLLRTAFRRATTHPYNVMADRILSEKMERLDKLAENCATLADVLLAYDPFDDLPARLMQQAARFELERDQAVKQLRSRLKERREMDDDPIRNYVVALCSTMENFFGNAMSGTVATIANCAIPGATETPDSVASKYKAANTPVVSDIDLDY